VVTLALGALAPAASAQDVGGDVQPLKSPNGLYIVQMAASPVIGYAGGVNGLRAPRIAEGALPDAASPDVQAYEAYLVDQHAQALAAVGGEKVYNYTWTFNGFAARLTPAQAAALQTQPGVVSVTPDEMVYADTVSTPTMLGLDKAGGLWAQLGGPGKAGEGIIIGVVDSGIWPESKSFADDGGYRLLPRWKGGCEATGEEWSASLCNNKLIGARYYNAGYGGNAGIDATRPWEYNSPRGYNGHGTHTASTAGGNYNVAASAEGSYLGQASGMAPRARISAYKALWDDGAGGSSGFTVDLVAAIEQAVKDGVNVINYSISGSRTSVNDAVAQAFLKAASAGVFVAASAGNSGPTASTVAHNYPWVMTVAAGTHDRDFVASVTTGDGAVYSGKSLGAGTPVAPLVLSTAAGLPGAVAEQVRLCYPGALDPAVVTGKIVLCDRGVNARVDKSLAVKQAGGIGMVLANVSPSSLNADLHYVPSVHVDEVAGAAIKAYIASAGAGATAQLAAGQKVVVDAPTVASFSSRGPALAVGGNLLKPDILAPGVDVLAAVSPAGGGGRDFDFYSGTSMAAPHVAGLAALLKHRQPAWTPDMIKSALMTTASQKTYAGAAIPGNPWGYGAGHVNPNAAVNPGLVFKLRPQDYAAFLCGQGLLTGNVCAIRNISVHDLNLPSAAVSQLAGSQVIHRSVYNVTNKTATYKASVEGLTGFTVEVTPAQITVAPGASASFSVKFTRTTATLNAYTFGAVKWTYGKYVVRMPVALRPVALAAPGEVDGAGTSGAATYQVTFGYTGDFAAKPHGLVEALKTTGAVSTDQYVDFAIAIPAGTKLARFSMYDEYTSKPSDLDLEIYGPTGALVGSSGSGTSAEEVNLSNPAAGTYTARVVGFGTGDSPTDFTLFSWAVTADDLGNLTVAAPAAATIAAKGDITLNWAGLNAGTKYLGIVTYHNVAAPAGYDDGRIGSTVVDIATD
jgi:subtilisin family serine protease